MNNKYCYSNEGAFMQRVYGIWLEFIFKISCNHELANEWAHCCGKNASCITIQENSLPEDSRLR